MINYQGRLLDAAGSPVTGSRDIVFTIYDAETGDSVLWQETRNISITDGLFNVLLGEVSPISDSVFNGDSRFLGIKIGSAPEAAERHRLVSVGYAMLCYDCG
ncbi:MAG: hypothetical protein QME81_19585 [bacterium]|nr:hypothetical protein [bacterium]